jgi:hypothetical protein
VARTSSAISDRPNIDLEQLAALRTLRRAFGDVQILEVIDHPGRDPAAFWTGYQGGLLDEMAPT